VVVADGRIIGFVTTLPIRIWKGDRVLPAYWLKGLMVLEEYRNGPVGHSLLKTAIADLPTSLVLTVAPASQRLFAAIGYQRLGTVPNFLRILRAGRLSARLNLDKLELRGLPSWIPALLRLLQRLGLAFVSGALLGMAFDAVAWVRTAAGQGRLRLTLEHQPPAAEILDRLWEAARPRLALAVVRDARYLLARYGPGTTIGLYRWALVYRDDRLVALAVARRPGAGDARLPGLRIGTVAELIVAADVPDAAPIALSGAESLARQWNADGLIASATHPMAIATLKRRTWLRIPGNLNFFVRDTTAAALAAGEISAWWIMRGDGESDGDM
jgi:hypothetical protein